MMLRYRTGRFNDVAFTMNEDSSRSLISSNACHYCLRSRRVNPDVVHQLVRYVDSGSQH